MAEVAEVAEGAMVAVVAMVAMVAVVRGTVTRGHKSSMGGHFSGALKWAREVRVL